MPHNGTVISSQSCINNARRISATTKKHDTYIPLSLFFFLSSNNAISSVKQASENYRLNYAFVLLMLHKEGGFAFLSKWPLSKTEV